MKIRLLRSPQYWIRLPQITETIKKHLSDDIPYDFLDGDELQTITEPLILAIDQYLHEQGHSIAWEIRPYHPNSVIQSLGPQASELLDEAIEACLPHLMESTRRFSMDITELMIEDVLKEQEGESGNV